VEVQRDPGVAGRVGLLPRLISLDPGGIAEAVFRSGGSGVLTSA
jgi:hypothetical protein